MKTRVIICTCLVLLLSPVVIMAADGPYISGHIGASWLSNVDFDGSVPGIRISSEVEFETGIHLGAAFGYDFGEFRVEGEFGYRSHEFKETTDLELNGIPSLTGKMNVVLLWFSKVGFFLLLFVHALPNKPKLEKKVNNYVKSLLFCAGI